MSSRTEPPLDIMMRSSVPIPDLSDRTCLITGATSGIGFETARALAAANAQLFIVARNEKKGRVVLAELKQRSAAGRVELLLCDLSSLQAVRDLAAAFLAASPALHILINNAGTLYPRRALTPEGIEKTFAVNYLGPFLLTNLVLPRLNSSAPARIVNVASQWHRYGSMEFDNLAFEHGYGMLRAYCRSKLGNVLFTAELARRLAGTKVTVNCLHPGAVATNIGAHAYGWAQPLIALLNRFYLSPQRGAETTTYLASSPEVEGVSGGYFIRCKPAKVSKAASDEALAKRLWETSAQMLGL